jgi:hypothetical protein
MKRVHDFNYNVYFNLHRDAKTGATLAHTIQTHCAVIAPDDAEVTDKQLDAIHNFLKKKIRFIDINKKFKSFSIYGEIKNNMQEITVAVS